MKQKKKFVKPEIKSLDLQYSKGIGLGFLRATGDNDGEGGNP